MTAIAPEFYTCLQEHSSYIYILLRFIFDSNFSLETRIIHPSYTAATPIPKTVPRPSTVVVDESDVDDRMLR